MLSLLMRISRARHRVEVTGVSQDDRLNRIGRALPFDPSLPIASRVEQRVVEEVKLSATVGKAPRKHRRRIAALDDVLPDARKV